MDELKDSGGQNAIWLALNAAIRSHPNPQRAARAALDAVEAEKVRQLNSSENLSEWGAGFDEAHEALLRLLKPVADDS